MYPTNSPLTGNQKTPWKPTQMVWFEIVFLSTLGEGRLLLGMTLIPSLKVSDTSGTRHGLDWS